MKTFPVLDPTLLCQVGRGFCALAVMTKAPQAGLVKTRLVPLLTPDEAAELNRAFLRDTAAAISNACCRRPVGDAASKSLPRQGSASHREAATITVCSHNAARNLASDFISLWRICSNAVLTPCA